MTMKKYLLFLLAFVMSAFLLSCDNDSEPPTEKPIVESRMRLNESDSITMVNIYNAIGPWREKWDFEDITTWNGVSVAYDLDTEQLRIVGLNVVVGNFDGQLPDCIGDLSELRVLVLAGGNLHGPIPESIGKLKHLNYLCLGDNNMYGEIPSSIGNLTELEWLRITNTKISGRIPESIGNLTKLRYLMLYGNSLTGEIPKSLANLENLEGIWLNNNKLSGTFPIEILSRTKPKQIICTYNNIEHLPVEVWDDSDNRCPPDLQYNRIQTEIPQWVTQQKKWQKGNYVLGNQQDGYGYRLVED